MLLRACTDGCGVARILLMSRYQGSVAYDRWFSKAFGAGRRHIAATARVTAMEATRKADD